jgi:acetyltransferase-like isoleucine patch superfamily enzyme
MKHPLKIVAHFCNLFVLALARTGFPLRSNRFFLFRVLSRGKNSFSIKKTNFERSSIRVMDGGNSVHIESAAVIRSSIMITGSNNRLIVEPGVQLRSAIIHIRGNGCLIHIGKDTTFGGVRMVNVGNDNSLTIGQGCLFADFIEVWAGDSHPIFDPAGNLINKEEPIIIGDRVWVGSRAIILKGVTIGDGSIIGMGSLVVNDVPAKTISVGNPNKIVRSDYGYWQLHYERP